MKFTADLSERKRILTQIRHAHPQWKARIALAGFFFFLAAAIFGGFVIMLILNPTFAFGVFIFLCAAVCLSCVPFFVALSVKNTAKFKCAFPYTSYANASLVLNEDSLEYVFWTVDSHQRGAYSSAWAVYPEEEECVYTINKKDIRSLKIQNEICKIKGKGIIETPNAASEMEYVEAICHDFSFILAFAQKDAASAITTWWKE